jgi:hypothetical protein
LSTVSAFTLIKARSDNVRTRLLAVVWWMSIARAKSPRVQPGDWATTLKAHNCAPPTPACRSTCAKWLFMVLNKTRN